MSEKENGGRWKKRGFELRREEEGGREGTRGAKGAPKCFPLNRLLLLFLPTDSLGRLSQPAIERTIGSPAATAAAAAAAAPAPAGRSRLDRLDDPAKEGRKEGGIIQAGTIFFWESKIKEGTRATRAREQAPFLSLVWLWTKDQKVCFYIPLSQ